MTRPGDPRTGRAWQALARLVIARDRGRCWRCGHLGADTAGHVLPISQRPDLALNLDNLRAEHGTRRTIEHDGYDCIGNYAAGARDTAPTPPTRRPWLNTTDDTHSNDEHGR